MLLSRYQGLCPGTGGRTPGRPSADLLVSS